MKEAVIILERAHAALERCLGGATLDPEAPEVTALEGALRLRAEIHPSEGLHSAIAHAHIISVIRAPGGEDTLDACVVGVGAERAEALADAGAAWGRAVCEPLASLLESREIEGAAHFDGEDAWGVRGCHGFVGPLTLRLEPPPRAVIEALGAEAPLFEGVDALSPPGRLHIAKVTITGDARSGWRRNVEINGHEVTYVDEGWQPGVEGLGDTSLILSRFALFHHAHQPEAIEARRALDEGIEAYLEVLHEDPEADPHEALIARGRPEAEVCALDACVPLAFARQVLADLEFTFPRVYALALPGGVAGPLEPLITNPAYARAFARGQRLMTEEGGPDLLRRVALISPELRALNELLKSGARLEDATPVPPLIPTAETTKEDFEVALEAHLARFRATRRS